MSIDYEKELRHIHKVTVDSLLDYLDERHNRLGLEYVRLYFKSKAWAEWFCKSARILTLPQEEPSGLFSVDVNLTIEETRE